jgi:hypothetical protein
MPGENAMQQNAFSAGSVRHRAEDDLFHFDRANAPKQVDCETGLSRTPNSAQLWVRSLRPRWLTGACQPLVRSRMDE